VVAVSLKHTWSSIWFFAMMIAVLLLRPQGLRGIVERGGL
jgi:branched-subunit amino acid ABC-type transport system permease component